jgi:hypothetical protein
MAPKKRRLTSNAKMPVTGESGDPIKTINTKISEELHAKIEAEAKRRGYPWTFTSVMRDALVRGMELIAPGSPRAEQPEPNQ